MGNHLSGLIFKLKPSRGSQERGGNTCGRMTFQKGISSPQSHKVRLSALSEEQVCSGWDVENRNTFPSRSQVKSTKPEGPQS